MATRKPRPSDFYEDGVIDKDGYCEALDAYESEMETRMESVRDNPEPEDEEVAP